MISQRKLIFSYAWSGNIYSVSEEEKRLLYADTHTFKQIIEIDGVSLIEWTATSPKNQSKSQKEFDEWVQNSKKHILIIKVGVFGKLLRWDGSLVERSITDKTLLRKALIGRKK